MTLLSVSEWNAIFPVGIVVRVAMDDEPTVRTRTKSAAFLQDNGLAKVFVHGFYDSVPLMRVEAAGPSPAYRLLLEAATMHGVEEGDIQGSSHLAEHVKARHYWWQRLWEDEGWSESQIARVSNRHPSTVHGAKKKGNWQRSEEGKKTCSEMQTHSSAESPTLGTR